MNDKRFVEAYCYNCDSQQCEDISTKWFKIEVSMNPNYIDNANCPYFWIIRSIVANNEDSNWCTEAAGWARTPLEAWQKAYMYWDDITST